jgi:hypothetical protein
MPGEQVLQRQLVDPEIVLGFDPVPLGLPVLGKQQQRRGVAAWVENTRLRRMNGYGSQAWVQATRLRAIQARTITVWARMKFQDPNQAVTRSAIRSPTSRWS